MWQYCGIVCFWVYFEVGVCIVDLGVFCGYYKVGVYGSFQVFGYGDVVEGSDNRFGEVMQWV